MGNLTKTRRQKKHDLLCLTRFHQQLILTELVRDWIFFLLIPNNRPDPTTTTTTKNDPPRQTKRKKERERANVVATPSDIYKSKRSTHKKQYATD